MFVLDPKQRTPTKDSPVSMRLGNPAGLEPLVMLRSANIPIWVFIKCVASPALIIWWLLKEIWLFTHYDRLMSSLPAEDSKLDEIV